MPHQAQRIEERDWRLVASWPAEPGRNLAAYVERREAYLIGWVDGRQWRAFDPARRSCWSEGERSGYTAGYRDGFEGVEPRLAPGRCGESGPD